MKKYIYKITLLTISIFITSCGSDEKSTVKDNSSPIVVKVSSITQDSDNPFLSASGKIEAVNSANLSTRIMGFVDKIYVNVGDKVKKGKLLLSINNADLEAKLAQVNANITEATAAYQNSEKDYNRFTSLFNDNSASQKELDDITAHYSMAKARLEAAKQMMNEINAQFSYVNIRAPFNGVITNKFIDAGNMANPGEPLLEIESPDKFQVMAMVPESQISQIIIGTKVDVLIKSLNKTLTGKVVEVSTSAKNTGGQYLVKIVLEKTDGILSGMYVSVQFPVEKTKTTPNVVLVSTGALIHKGQLTGIYTVSQNNKALLRWLRLGRTFGDKVEVLSGLNIDEKYIISAEGKLYNGAKITIK
ncbi:MAG: efflux RND transporter periplasmic adaptor subunit [Flavobacteriaceae bacterium]|nr:efflux RND transporter periplasmic adaptor subunit [Flavobacteriaceae bacterium]